LALRQIFEETENKLIYLDTITSMLYTVIYTGWSKKQHKVNDTIILQLYIICGF